MVTPNNLLEAAKVPLFLQTSLIPKEVSSRCHIFKEFRKKLQELEIVSTNPYDRLLHFEKT